MPTGPDYSRAIWSALIGSNRAVKLPLPKPASSLSWATLKKIGPMTVFRDICRSISSGGHRRRAADGTAFSPNSAGLQRDSRTRGADQIAIIPSSGRATSDRTTKRPDDHRRVDHCASPHARPGSMSRAEACHGRHLSDTPRQLLFSIRMAARCNVTAQPVQRRYDARQRGPSGARIGGPRRWTGSGGRPNCCPPR